MSKTNDNLHKAKQAKNDEYYTRLEDIENELQHYDLSGKWVYSPFDDYRSSKFVTYFTDHFKDLNLKHYTATCIDLGQGAWRYDYDGEHTTITQLENGDYACDYCAKIKDECDIVISNPPFSKFRDIIKWLQ